MYGLLSVSSDGQPDWLVTGARLREASPALASFPLLDHLLAITLQVAALVLGKSPGSKKHPEHQWLFELAGRLKGAVPREERDQTALATTLSPLALVFVDAVEAYGGIEKNKGRIAWGDADAVMLEFEEIWDKRKFAKGSPYLEEAAEFALNTPLQIHKNKHFTRVLSVAYYLQTRQPELPILLPVSAKLAGLLHTTPVTLGTAIVKAVREGYLEVVDGHFDIKAGKARSFRFNFDHPMIQAILRGQ